MMIEPKRHKDESQLPDWGLLTHEERIAQCPKPFSEVAESEHIERLHTGIRNALCRSAKPRAYWTADESCLEAYFDRDEALEALREATEIDDGVDEAREDFDAADEAFDIALVTFYQGLTWADRVRLTMDEGDDAPTPVTPTPANDNKRFARINAQELLSMEFAPVKYIVPNYIAEGLTLLGGRPKLGKSWLALDFGVAVSSGGISLGETCEAGDALYLALEDNQRRLQDRLRTILPKSHAPDLSRLTLQTEAPKVGAGLIESLDAWRKSVADPRIVIIDTLAMVRPPKKPNQDNYAADYEALSPLQKWAGQHRLALVVVTHVRKMEAADPLEMISGTNGITGAADSIMVLDKKGDGPKIYGRGRDIMEIEKSLTFDDGKWSVIGDVVEVKRSTERSRVLEVLEESTFPMSPAEIAKEAGMKPDNIRQLLRKMVADAEIEKIGRGTYRLPERSLWRSQPDDE